MSTDLQTTFTRVFTSLHGHVHTAKTWEDAASIIGEIAGTKDGGRVATAQLPAALMDSLRRRISSPDDLLAPPYPSQDLSAHIDGAVLGVTGIDFGIAETGTLVEVSRNDATRLVSSLPRAHIGIVSASNFVRGLYDAAPRLRATFAEYDDHVVVSFLSGPSRTGDIELKLTLGVHGPEEAHAIVVNGELPWDTSDA